MCDMDISIAGNSSLAYYCVEKLCRNDIKVARIFIPAKGYSHSDDAMDFSGLRGEFDFDIITVPNKSDVKYTTDILINLEWPGTLQLPVKSKLGIVDSNLAGQFDNEYLLDIAADIYNGRKMVEVQLLLDQAFGDNQASEPLRYEPPFFQVLSSASLELNHLDDLRSAKTKAITRFFRLLHKILIRINNGESMPKPIKTELLFSKVKTERIIDWTKGAMYLHNLIRALTHPGPGAQTWYDDRKVTIWRGHYFELAETNYIGYEPGAILDVIEELGLIVKTGHGSFLATRIQSAGAPELPAWVWADKEHVNIGDKFNVHAFNNNYAEKV